MAHEQMLKSLVRLGLSEVDAEIYLFLAKEGSQKVGTVAEKLTIRKQQIYRNLRRLRKKGIVNATQERPAFFSAVSPEKILNLIIDAKKEQALALQESREELLSRWKAITKEGSKNG